MSLFGLLQFSKQQAPSARCLDIEDMQGHGGDDVGCDGERM